MPDLTHLNYLEKYLQVHGIKYERIDQEEIFDSEKHIAQCERHQIIVPCSGDDFQWDAICHKGSYGFNHGLLEIYGNIVDEEKDGDSVVGWLTAQDVIARIQAKERTSGKDDFIINVNTYYKPKHRAMIKCAWKHKDKYRTPCENDLLHYWSRELRYTVLLSDVLYVFDELIMAGYWGV